MKLERKMQIFLALIIGAFLVLVARLVYLQLVEVDKYKTMARQNHQRLFSIAAPRGEIVDRRGVRLAGNRPEYIVSLTYLGLKNTKQVAGRLAQILVKEKSFQGMSAEEIERYIYEQVKKQKVRLYEPVQVAEKVSLVTVAKIEENRLDLPGVVIDVEPVRDYPFGDLLGPVLGFVREIDRDELERNKEKDYQMGDNIGKTGLELEYEEVLRGERGGRVVEVDARGRPVRDLGVKAPVSGNSLVLTIDSRLQQVAEAALAKGVERARYLGYAKVSDVVTGAAVALNVQTGEVLAMASYPGYDPGIFTGIVLEEQLNRLARSDALKNHAIQSIYPPGSTFKMVTATALLEGKIVTPETTIFDPGYYKYKKDWKPGGHGKVNIRRALQVSCDTFFYMFGVQAGPELMGRYAKEYGLGEKTGIDLPGEVSGTVPSREHKAKTWHANPWESRWYEYDSMDMAIGQQENKYTPLQLVNYVASIANGGKIYQPYLVKKIINPDGRVIKEFFPHLIRRVNVASSTLQVIREGMHMATLFPEGTAAGVFAGAGYSAAAKTGTAEVGDKAESTHALFLAFAPYESPEIAVSVVIGYGGRGSTVAGPVAREILDAWFALKNKDEQKVVDEAVSHSVFSSQNLE